MLYTKLSFMHINKIIVEKEETFIQKNQELVIVPNFSKPTNEGSCLYQLWERV